LIALLSLSYRADADATPVACIAVTDTAPRIVYEPAPVLEAARQSYFNWDVSEVSEANMVQATLDKVG
jgi:hypothetical protein